MLAAVTLTDLEQRIIPNKILLAGAILCLAIAAPTDPAGLPERAIAAAAAGGLLFLVALAYPRDGPWRRQAGGDDGPLPRPRGRAGDPRRPPGRQPRRVALIARHGSEARKMAIPFGPFLALGGVVGDARRQPADRPLLGMRQFARHVAELAQRARNSCAEPLYRSVGNRRARRMMFRMKERVTISVEPVARAGASGREAGRAPNLSVAVERALRGRQQVPGAARST